MDIDLTLEPEQVRARRARREVRRAAIYSRIGEALGKPSSSLSRTAGSQWNIPVEGEARDSVAIGSQHPGAAALLVVRQALSEFRLASQADLRYAGMKRVSGHGGFGIDEGVITVHATVCSLSGPRHFVEIPVIVREGRLLSPSILVHEGNKRVLAQSTFDDILGMGEFKENQPDRSNMYAPPPERGAAARRTIPLLRPGMFAVQPSRHLITSALRGFVQHADHEVEAGPKDWLAGGALALGLGMSGQPAHAEPYNPANQGVHAPATAPASPKAPWKPGSAVPPGVGKAPRPEATALDDVQRQKLEWIENALPSLRAKYAKDPKLQAVFMEGYKSGADEEAAHAKLSDLSKQHGTTSSTVAAFRDGVQYMKLKMEKEFLKKGGREAGFREDWARTHPRKVLVDCEMCGGTGEAYMRTRDGDVDGPFGCELCEGTGQVEAPDDDDTNDDVLSMDGGRQAFYTADVTGVLPNGSLGRDVPGANGSHLDAAERVTDSLMPGQKVRLKSGATTRDRGGCTYDVPKGTMGVVVRDVDGANWAYLVRLELGFVATVPRNALA